MRGQRRRPRACRTFETGHTSHTMPRSASSREQRRVLDGADAVTQAVGTAARRARRGSTPGPATSPAWGTEPRPASFAMRNASRVRLGRVLRLEPAEPEPDDAAVAVLHRVARGLERRVEREAARDVGREPHDRRRSPPRPASAPSQKPVNTSSHDAPVRTRSAGREDALDVDRAVRGRLRGVVDDDLAEVDVGPDRVRGHDPELDEVVEVAELVERRRARRLGRGRQRRTPLRRGDARAAPAARTVPSRWTCSSIFGSTTACPPGRFVSAHEPRPGSSDPHHLVGAELHGYRPAGGPRAVGCVSFAERPRCTGRGATPVSSGWARPFARSYGYVRVS